MKKTLIIVIGVVGILLSLTAIPISALANTGCPCCCESFNPHGLNIPPAGWSTEPGTNPNSGKNPDGFYAICIPCDCPIEPHPVMYVSYVGSDNPQLFGPYEHCLTFKLTEAKGAMPQDKKIGSTNGQAGAVAHHFLLPADALISFYSGETLIYQTTCVVPPPPK